MHRQKQQVLPQKQKHDAEEHHSFTDLIQLFLQQCFYSISLEHSRFIKFLHEIRTSVLCQFFLIRTLITWLCDVHTIVLTIFI